MKKKTVKKKRAVRVGELTGAVLAGIKKGRPPSPLDAKKEEPPEVMKLPGGQLVAKHIYLDKKLATLTRTMGLESFDFLEAAEAVVKDRLFIRLHYQSAGDYFSQRFGYSYPALRKRLEVLTGLARIEHADGKKERKACREELSALGITKATILAPVLGLDRQGVIPGTSGGKVDDWRAWVKKAKQVSVEDLQREVARVLNQGAGPKGKKGGEEKQSADAAWFERTLAVLSPDVAPEVEEVFSAGLTAYQTDSYLYVFALLVKGMKVEVIADAEKRGWKPVPVQTEIETAAAGAPAGEA